MRVCAKKGCRTILSKYNPDDRCSIHPGGVSARYDWAGAKDRWFEERKVSGEPPMGHEACRCGRTHKTTTSCLCAVTPAPKQPPWEFYRPGEAA